MLTKPTEEEVAAHLVPWLEDMEWEVHQEVQLRHSANRADIVARRGRMIWAIEVKTSLSIGLIEQAARWIGHANYVSIAAPSGPSLFVQRWLEHLGLGAFAIRLGVTLIVQPRLARHRSKNLEARLCEETRTWGKAGSTTGSEYFTPFRATCRSIADEVRRQPGIKTKELMERIKHHYRSESTARSCLVRWALNGKVRGVRVEIPAGEKAMRWYPAEEHR